MRSLFYPRMALINLRKNAKFNVPYLLTCIGTTAMFYMMSALAKNSGYEGENGSDAMRQILKLGTIVIGIFSVIFLLYTNSFLIKRRQKEFGLYNILGMEKRHISRILSVETAFLALGGLAGGLGCGILFNKLLLLLLAKFLRFSSDIQFELSPVSIRNTVLLFGGISLLNLLLNLIRIRFSKPIALLYGAHAGEREPKTKLLMTILGIACLGVGYTIALVTEKPIQALTLFFVAVVLVILGTYFLFTAGSIALLKLLRKNKNYYYQTRHFTTISGMLYRMKQNAVGLANICVLSTMVLVMVSGTVCMYIGVEDALKTRFVYEVSVTESYPPDQAPDPKQMQSLIQKTADDCGRTCSDMVLHQYFTMPLQRTGDAFGYIDPNAAYTDSVAIFLITTASAYTALTGTPVSLAANEVWCYDVGDAMQGSFNLLGQDFTITEKLGDFPYASDYAGFITSIKYLVVSDDAVLRSIYDSYPQTEGYQYYYNNNYGFNIDGTDDEKLAFYEQLEKVYAKDKDPEIMVSSESRQSARGSFYVLYGSLFFTGTFLGLLFLMATALIIYYKQISEGYEDKERFRILKQVGMSHAEVRATIRSQVLTVFFLPLVMAAIHVLAAFKMITKLLLVLNLTNVALFAWCTVGTLLAFAILYAIIYAVTARAYYKIVQ